MVARANTSWIVASSIVCTTIFILLFPLSRAAVQGIQGFDGMDVMFMWIFFVMTVQSRLLLANMPVTTGRHVWIVGTIAALMGWSGRCAYDNWFSLQPDPPIFLGLAAIAVLSALLAFGFDPRRKVIQAGEAA